MIVVESEDGNKGTLHQNRVRQRRKILTDTCKTLLSHFLKVFQTTALLPSTAIPRPQDLAPTCYTWLQWYISEYSSAQGILCACVFLVISINTDVYTVLLYSSVFVRLCQPTTCTVHVESTDPIIMVNGYKLVVLFNMTFYLVNSWPNYARGVS